jgi:hypothetical protein
MSSHFIHPTHHKTPQLPHAFRTLRRILPRSPAIARRSRDVRLDNSQPLIQTPERFSFGLYAQETFDSYLLHLGNPNEESD